MSRVLRELDAEWRRIARGPQARRALMRWKATYPALAGLADFEQLLARREHDRVAAPEVLAALAALAPNDDLAARVLLQAVMPALIRLALVVGSDDRLALDEMISLAWERIRTYPASRGGSVAANVIWDVRKQYRCHREIDLPRKRHHRDPFDDRARPDSDDAVAERSASAPSAEDEALQHVVLDDLVEAQRQGVISEPALRLIVQTRIVGEPLSEVSVRSGINRNTLMAQRFRAERRLRELQLAG